jgi:hypothetical protein
MPWWVYERNGPHYGRKYWRHFKLNVEQALTWATFSEKVSDYDFEAQLNTSWGVVFSRMFRWTKFRRMEKEKFTFRD